MAPTDAGLTHGARLAAGAAVGVVGDLHADVAAHLPGRSLLEALDRVVHADAYTADADVELGQIGVRLAVEAGAVAAPAVQVVEVGVDARGARAGDAAGAARLCAGPAFAHLALGACGPAVAAVRRVVVDVGAGDVRSERAALAVRVDRRPVHISAGVAGGGATVCGGVRTREALGARVAGGDEERRHCHQNRRTGGEHGGVFLLSERLLQCATE